SQHLARLLRGLDDARAPREPLPPALDEEPAVALHPPARALGAARAVQEVHDPRARLVHRAEAPLAQSETEIGVLEVARREELVEAARLEEEFRRDEHAGRRAEVDLPPEAMLEVAGVAVSADHVAVADRVHDRTGLLERAVLVQVHRDDGADSGVLERLEERRQPAGL